MIKAPNPKHPNRPTGDTSTATTLPAGINDFAVHPSLKLMVSVGRAERCLRLWNLVTGRKAGVLNFPKNMLKAVGESSSRWGSGEGRKVLWNNAGDEFAVGFEWGICIFGEDCTPKAIIKPTPRTKIHQIHYVLDINSDILSVSTEDGRVLFYSTSTAQQVDVSLGSTNGNGKEDHGSMANQSDLPSCSLLGQLGGIAVGLTGRIKDFAILPIANPESDPIPCSTFLVVTVGSDGVVRVWALKKTEWTAEDLGQKDTIRQIGRLIGAYETGNRITCMKAFIMTGKAAENGGESDDEDDIKSSKSADSDESDSG